MLQPVTIQTSHGDNSPNMSGERNTFKGGDDASRYDRFLDELAAQRGLTEKSLGLLEKRDAQIDRLIALLERVVPEPANA